MFERDFDKELSDLKELIKNVTGEDGLKRINYAGKYFSSAQVSVKCDVTQKIVE
jgi:hypothetical protein